MKERENTADTALLKIPAEYCGTDESGLGQQLMKILTDGDIKTLFQPIISLNNGAILGYEALSRGPKETVLESPEKLFDMARIFGKLWELEFLCRLKALENANKSCPGSLLFLNVDPAIIKDDKFKKGFTKDFLKKYNMSPQDIIFEITEKNAVSDYYSFRKTLDNYKEQGYQIAIDDTGAGYSGLTLIAEIHPQFIKLDMNLIRDIDKNGLKRTLIKTFHDFCRITNIKLIAEGIETKSELDTLIDIGIEYGQGYFIQRPSNKILPIEKTIKSLIKERNETKRRLYLYQAANISVGYISRSCDHVPPNASGAQVLEAFNRSPALHALPVIDNQRVSGLVMKENFFAKLGTKYGFALYLNRPISSIMDRQPLAVDYDTKIDVVSKSAMTRTDAHLYDNIIVTKNEEYHGIITVKDLLEKTTEMEVNHAKHLNPLTGLPGNILIEAKLTDFIENNGPYTVLYIDIDNFKVYNDIYGFESGDNMLLSVANIIVSCVSGHCPDDSFVGHIGGDDYVIMLPGHQPEELCKAIIQNHSTKLKSFYSREDFMRGYVIAKNRHGVEERFSHATLSIAGITNKKRQFDNIYELSEHATRLKKKCKEIWDNCIIID